MQTVRAILLMIFSMALLALSDLFIKLSSLTAPLGQIMLFLSIGGTLLFIGIARGMRTNLLSRDALHPMVLLRCLFEIVAALAMIIGIANIPLTMFAAIMQVAPILVVMGGAIFLRENVGWRRWAAVFAGLLGMLIVIRPWGESFTPYAIFAVIGVSGLAGRDLVTRLAPDHIPAISLSTWGFAATIPTGLIVMAWERAPLTWDALTLLYIALGVIVTAGGYFAITLAMRMAPVSIVAPFRYTRLLFTASLGLMFLGETLDTPTVIGSVIILAAGLYTFIRERRLALTAEAEPQEIKNC